LTNGIIPTPAMWALRNTTPPASVVGVYTA
jgi:hypothetical protein